MTKTLKKAFDEASKLPEREQEALGEWLLAELESERKWDELFRKSTEVLDRLADEALAEHRAGYSKELDPEKL